MLPSQAVAGSMPSYVWEKMEETVTPKVSASKTFLAKPTMKRSSPATTSGKPAWRFLR